MIGFGLGALLVLGAMAAGFDWNQLEHNLFTAIPATIAALAALEAARRGRANAKSMDTGNAKAIGKTVHDMQEQVNRNEDRLEDQFDLLRGHIELGMRATAALDLPETPEMKDLQERQRRDLEHAVELEVIRRHARRTGNP